MPDEPRDILDDLEDAINQLDMTRVWPSKVAVLKRVADEIRRLRADRIKPKPSELPVEQIVKDARLAIEWQKNGCDVISPELPFHVLALVEENERLRAEVAEHEAAERDLLATLAHTMPTSEDLKKVQARLSSLAKGD